GQRIQPDGMKLDGIAEQVDAEELELKALKGDTVRGEGKRTIRANTLYSSSSFWRHDPYESDNGTGSSKAKKTRGQAQGKGKGKGKARLRNGVQVQIDIAGAREHRSTNEKKIRQDSLRPVTYVTFRQNSDLYNKQIERNGMLNDYSYNMQAIASFTVTDSVFNAAEQEVVANTTNGSLKIQHTLSGRRKEGYCKFMVKVMSIRQNIPDHKRY
ncbi:hypothetical protein EV360DRAFT_75788, partial [Lentinula raphanica]